MKCHAAGGDAYDDSTEDIVTNISVTLLLKFTLKDTCLLVDPLKEIPCTFM